MSNQYKAKQYKKSTKRIVENAYKLAESLRKQGMTKDKAAEALKKILEEMRVV